LWFWSNPDQLLNGLKTYAMQRLASQSSVALVRHCYLFGSKITEFFTSLQIYTITASIAFINIGKNRGIFKKSECDYTQLLADFFGDSCAPGSRDQLHDPSGTTPQSLCNLCREAIVPFAAPIHDEEEETDVQYDEATGDDDVGVDEDDKPAASVPNVQVEITRNVNCAANPTNQFYGTRGALSCLQQ
jgi:hypothetical protein